MTQKQLSPRTSEKVKIKKSLFAWVLHLGKKYIECNSEEEARYLKVFYEAGLTKIKIPKEKNYLRIILPELEKLKKKIDKIIHAQLETIVSPKTKKLLKSRLWSEIIK